MSKVWNTHYWKTRAEMKNDLFNDFRNYPKGSMLSLVFMGCVCGLHTLMIVMGLINKFTDVISFPLYYGFVTIAEVVMISFVCILIIPITFFLFRSPREFKANERAEKVTKNLGSHF